LKGGTGRRGAKKKKKSKSSGVHTMFTANFIRETLIVVKRKEKGALNRTNTTPIPHPL